jgi:hypothetical protein
MSKPKKNFIKELIKNASEASNDLSGELPKVIRLPLKISIFTIYGLLLPILVAPLSPILFLFRNKKRVVFQDLIEDLKTVWESESSEIALNRLRKINTTIYENIQTHNRYKNIKIEPFGVFTWSDYFKVNETLYHWELQHHNWDKAEIVIDQFLDFYKNDDIRDRHIERWIVYKARIINKQKSNLAAQQYLMQYIDPKIEDCPIREYLYELRDTEP